MGSGEGGLPQPPEAIYDELGRQESVTRQDGTAPALVTTYLYDQDGRITAVSGPEGTIAYEYDELGRKIRTATPATDTRFSYDQLGRQLAVSVYKRGGQVLTEPEVTTYTYTEVGSRESQILPNGITTLYAYDELNRLTNLSHLDAGGDILGSFTYTLAPSGRRLGVQEQLRGSGELRESTISYSYDQLNRLTTETSVADTPERNFATDYIYDLVGNRLVKSTTRNNDGVAEDIAYAYNAGDQLVSETSSIPTTGTTLYAFDVNGSLTGKNNPTTSEAAAYTYSIENRLAVAEISRREKDRFDAWHNIVLSAAYDYDIHGIRTRADSATSINAAAPVSTTRRFLIDHQNHTGYAQVANEYDQTTLRKSYIIADDILAQTIGGAVSWFGYDGHGSTRLLANSAGDIASTFSYDAYGVNLFPANTVEPAATDLLYSGEQFDPGLQMNYHRARYYDMHAGIWNRLDPFSGNHSDPQSLHKYTYCHGDPVNGWDPSGLLTLVELLVGVSGAFMALNLYVYAAALAKRRLKSIEMYRVSQALISLFIGRATGVSGGTFAEATRDADMIAERYVRAFNQYNGIHWSQYVYATSLEETHYRAGYLCFEWAWIMHDALGVLTPFITAYRIDWVGKSDEREVKHNYIRVALRHVNPMNPPDDQHKDEVLLDPWWQRSPRAFSYPHSTRYHYWNWRFSGFGELAGDMSINGYRWGDNGWEFFPYIPYPSSENND